MTKSINQENGRTGNKHPRFASFLLGFSMFATGACGLVFEYILSTVSTYILGNSIEQFSITIALMLLMMGVAGYVQKFMSDRYLIEKFIFLETFLALLGGYAPIAIYASFGFVPDHFMVINYFFVMAIGFLIGFEIPLVLRINEKYSETLGTNIAGVVGPDYIGSFVGAIVWTFFLLKTFPLTEISFLVGGTNFFIAAITFMYFMKYGLVRYRIICVILIVISAALLAFGYLSNRDWNLNLEQKLYDSKIVFSKTTKYQRLVLTHDAPLNDYRFFINGNLQFSSVDEAIYHEHLVHPAFALVQNPERVLILGGGDGLALREVLKHPQVKNVLLVDLDPDMVKVCSTNSILTRLNNHAFDDAKVIAKASEAISGDGRTRVFQDTGKVRPSGEPETQRIASVKIMNVDADRFLDQAPGQWDIVIIDFPDPSSVELVKLYSREFYRKLARAAAPGAMVVVQATSPYHARESYLCIRRTLESAGWKTLPYHDNVPSFGDWGWLLAWKNRGESEIREKIAAMESFGVDTAYLTPDAFRAALSFGKGALETKETRVNTLMEPALLTYYLDDSWKAE
ncbi:polyamine aminopropyltransferase [Desulfatibacillum aliphaticivorans]|uniref:polyamine aminopropyltransferase n=1 Tax=Desulfatibacillum aliphaticivorans TaxID=218208 RepID=UPI000429C299|nr:polyamine aminopropyltransferase [Desulfatibacillum aliphaticivorans]